MKYVICFLSHLKSQKKEMNHEFPAVLKIHTDHCRGQMFSSLSNNICVCVYKYCIYHVISTACPINLHL